jgi:hypothetical protein
VTVDPMSPSIGTMSPEPEALEPAANRNGRARAQAVECMVVRPMVGDRREGARSA